MDRLARLSSRFWGLALCFLFSLMFLLFQGGKLAFMLFIMVTALCAYLGLSHWSGISKTQGVRTLTHGYGDREPVLEAGTSLSVKIEVRIPGFWPIPYVSIKDRLIRRGGEEQLFEAFLIPDWKRRGEVSYRTQPLRRGYYHFGRTECATEDIFGLFEHKGTLDLPYSFAVLPQKAHIREWKQLHHLFRGVHHHSATTRSHRETTQINGVREYIYGDRLARIHWNATAKTGTWKSKEFERESLPKTVIVLDRNMRAYKDKDDFELAVSVAASLLDYGARKDLAIGLLSVGKQFHYFEPKLGAGHHKAIVNHLIEVEADGQHALPDVLKNRAKLFSPGIFVGIITPQHGESLAQTLAWIEQRQMVPCPFWIARSQTAAEVEHWRRQMKKGGHMAYAVQFLEELETALGGRFV